MTFKHSLFNTSAILTQKHAKEVNYALSLVIQPANDENLDHLKYKPFENLKRNAKHSHPCIQVVANENILMHLKIVLGEKLKLKKS